MTDLPINLDDPILTDFFDRLQLVFGDMDRQYDAAAESYGFHCNGCEDNCCRTRFYHHTYLEYFYIHAGLDKLAPKIKQEVQSRAAHVCRKIEKSDDRAASTGLMCPLNSDGLCILYRYRPMICRLHGIPHELRKPGQDAVQRPGCEMFTDQCSNQRYRKFDRTPFYFGMAKLESELKQAVGLSGKIKMTISEMIMTGRQMTGDRGQTH